MTNEEAIRGLKLIKMRMQPFPTNEIFDMAIEALEKQISKKPIREERTIAHEMGWDEVKYEKQIVFHCPCCKGIVSKEYPKNNIFCNGCGQRINWSESEES